MNMAASQQQSAEDSPKPTFTISSSHKKRIYCIAWLPGDRIVTGSDDKTIQIWNLTDGTQEGTSMVHEGPVYQILATKDGRIVSRCHGARLPIAWSANTQQHIEGPWSNEDHGPLEKIALSHNEALLASCHKERLVFWEMSGTRRVRNFIRTDSFQGRSGYTYAACLSPTGTRIAVSYGGLSVADVESGEIIIGPLRERIISVSWTHDGARIFCGDPRDKIYCFNSETGESVGEPCHHPGQVKCLSLSPDGKYLASGSIEGTIRFWDVNTDNPVGEPLSHTSCSSAIAFSPSGEFLATGGGVRGGSKEISIWRVPGWDREALNPLLDTSAVVSPDASGPSNVPGVDFLDMRLDTLCSLLPNILTLLLATVRFPHHVVATHPRAVQSKTPQAPTIIAVCKVRCSPGGGGSTYPKSYSVPWTQCIQAQGHHV